MKAVSLVVSRLTCFTVLCPIQLRVDPRLDAIRKTWTPYARGAFSVRTTVVEQANCFLATFHIKQCRRNEAGLA